MFLMDNWYTYEAATSKYGIPKAALKEMVDLGLIRTELQEDKSILLNGDDIEQELSLMPTA